MKPRTSPTASPALHRHPAATKALRALGGAGRKIGKNDVRFISAVNDNAAHGRSANDNTKA